MGLFNYNHRDTCVSLLGESKARVSHKKK